MLLLNSMSWPVVNDSLELAHIDARRECVCSFRSAGDHLFLPALIPLLLRVDLLARSEFAAIEPDGVRVLSLERFEVRQLFIGDGARDQRVSQFFAAYAAIYSWFASQQPVFVDQLQTVAQGRAQIFPFRPGQLPVHQADYYLSCLKSEGDRNLHRSTLPPARLWSIPSVSASGWLTNLVDRPSASAPG